VEILSKKIDIYGMFLINFAEFISISAQVFQKTKIHKSQ